MAAFNRPTKATYEVHENVTLSTEDSEDHTFCGIMFPVKCRDFLPLEYLVIKSVSVRGRLGPMTVWVSNKPPGVKPEEGLECVSMRQKDWTQLYEKTHSPSIRKYKELVLDTPIILRPGETKVIYIHSTRPGDEAIVYDNSGYGPASRRYEDDKLAILSGRAHVSCTVFGDEPIWGWGDAWRNRREFVGVLNYGTVYKLWNPHLHLKFADKFQKAAVTLFMCQRRWESPISMLPDVCIFYILNMCTWDWFGDDSNTMVKRRNKEKERLQAVAAEAAKNPPKEDAKPAAARTQCPSHKAAMDEAMQDADVHMEDDDDDEDEDFVDDAGEEDDDDFDEGDDDEESEVNSDEYVSDEGEFGHGHTSSMLWRFHVDSDEEEEREPPPRIRDVHWRLNFFRRLVADLEDTRGGNL